MADPRFFTNAGPFSLGDLAVQIGASLAEGGDPSQRVADVAPLDQAGADHLSFLDNKKYVGAFIASKAGACILHPSMQAKAPAGMALLLSPDPYRSYAKAAALFYPAARAALGIAASACVDPSAIIGADISIAPGVVIGARAEIGDRCQIGPNAVVGDGVVVGPDSIIGANASLSHCLIGARVNVYPGCRIGQDGFGFAMGPQGHLKVPQLGRVIIEDDVEVGANCTIDRGAGPDTVIGQGSRIDNLVQIAHNVRIGRHSVIVAQAGISGSTQLGDFVVVAGQAGLTGHLQIGSGAKIAAQSGVMRNVAAGETVGGSPAVPMTEWLRQSALLNQMARKKGQ